MTSWLWMALAFGGCEDRSDAASGAVSKALTAMVGSARAAEDPSDLIERVHKLVEDGALCTDAQRLNAAYVLMEGDPDDLRVAHDLARQVFVSGGNAQAGDLAARAWDLAAIREGEPQGYGVVKGKRGTELCLYAIGDTITDEERAALGIEPLQALLDGFGAEVGLAPPVDAKQLQQGGHLCDLEPELPREDSAPETEVLSSIPRNSLELTYGELYGSMPYWSGNAYTVRKGTFVLRPFRRSAYGVTDHVQVGTAVLGWLYAPQNTGRHGANLSVELAALAGREGALSFEVAGFLPWKSLDAPAVHGEAELKGTVRLSRKTMLTVATYGGLSHYGSRAIEFQEELEYDLQAKLGTDIDLGRSTMLVLQFRNDVDAWYRQQVFAWGTSLHVAYGKGTLGLSGGLNLERPAEVATSAGAASGAGAPSFLTSMAIVPVPQAQIWFRI